MQQVRGISNGQHDFSVIPLTKYHCHTCLCWKMASLAGFGRKHQAKRSIAAMSQLKISLKSEIIAYNDWKIH